MSSSNKEVQIALQPEQLLALLAVRIKQTYVFWRRMQQGQVTGNDLFLLSARWDGHTDRLGKAHANAWHVLAKFMLRYNLDPYACIELRFRQKMGTRLFVTPVSIAQPRYLADYKAVTQQLHDTFVHRLETEQNICRVEILNTADMWSLTGRAAWKRVLLDASLPLSPLFRLCLADSERLRSVVQRFVEPALVQYITAVEQYDAAWPGWIPAWFRRQVVHLRRSVVRKVKQDATELEEGK